MEKIGTSPALRAFFCVLLSVALASGCGYRPAGSSVQDRVGLSGLALSVVDSTSSSLGFEAEFTRLIRREFISFSGVPLMPEADAPYVLECSVREIDTRPLRYTPTRSVVQGQERVFWQTSARRLSVSIDARLIERASGNVLWHDSSIVGTATWNIGADPLADREAQRAAVRQIAGQVASELYSRTLVRF